MHRSKPIIYLILSTNLAPLSELKRIAQASIQGGAQRIQFRHKGEFTHEVFETVKAVRSICSVPFFINDRFDIALAVDADGVHLGQTDTPIYAARRFWPKLLGATISKPEQIAAAVSQGADHVSIGHIFFTSTKVKTTPPFGVDALSQIVSPVPLFAIGGIDESNIASIPKNLAGIAIASAICLAKDPEEATRRLLCAM